MDNGIQCDSWNWPAIIFQWVTGFLMCLGAMMVVVGSATYLSINRAGSCSQNAVAHRGAITSPAIPPEAMLSHLGRPCCRDALLCRS